MANPPFGIHSGNKHVGIKKVKISQASPRRDEGRLTFERLTPLRA